MDLYPTHEGRWVVRDTHSAPARAVITRLTQDGADLFRATEFHVVPASAPLIGDFTTLSDAFDAVRTHTSASSRSSRHSPPPE